MTDRNRKDNLLSNDTFASLLGIEIEQVGGGEAKATMVIKPDHYNGHGSVHGAVIFSLADITFAAACNSEVSAIGVQADIRYLSKPEEGRLHARAFEVSASRKLANYQVDISDEAGEIVALRIPAHADHRFRRMAITHSG